MSLFGLPHLFVGSTTPDDVMYLFSMCVAAIISWDWHRSKKSGIRSNFNTVYIEGSWIRKNTLGNRPMVPIPVWPYLWEAFSLGGRTVILVLVVRATLTAVALCTHIVVPAVLLTVHPLLDGTDEPKETVRRHGGGDRTG